MDKIAKLLKRLSAKERVTLEKALTLLIAGHHSSLDIKKLKGTQNIYRVRVGSLRVIFQMQGEEVWILEISRRDENTYKNY